MQKKTLSMLSAFNYACMWNAILYSVHKLISIVLLFFLYLKLSPQLFSSYCSIVSYIFLLLLWGDFGFRKSIACFLPEYEKHSISIKKLFSKLIKIKLIILFFSLPLFIFVSHKTAFNIRTQSASITMLSIAALFISEGIILFFQLIYQVSFLHKQFNTIFIFSLCFHTLVSFIASFYLKSNTLIFFIFISKSIINSITIFFSYNLFFILDSQLQKLTLISGKKELQASAASLTELPIQFAKHSFFMWIGILVKSSTERNVLFPFFTFIFGTDIANAFKITHETSLFFYRTLFKAIEISDTSLLSYANILSDKSFFYHLKKKITFFCTISFSLFFIFFIYKSIFFKTSFTLLCLFFTMTTSNIIEVYLSLYERLLEVRRQYTTLLKGYSFYIASILLLLLFLHSYQLTLYLMVIFIQIIRILTALIFRYYAKKLR